MVGVQAGHETSHTCSAAISRPAGSPQAGTGPSMSITSGTKSRAWSAARSTPKAKSCPGVSSPCAFRGSPSAKRCLSKEAHDASEGFCGVDIHRVLVQSNLLRVIEPEQPQAAQRADTCGKPRRFGIPTAGMPGWRPAQQRSQVWRGRSRMPEPSASWRSCRRLPSLAVNPTSHLGRGRHRVQIHSRTAPRRSNVGRASTTDSKRSKRTSSTELQRTVADQLIRLFRLDCPDERRRAAVAGLSRAQ